MLERNMTVEAAVMENPKVLKEIQKLGGEYDFIAMESLEDALKSLGEDYDLLSKKLKVKLTSRTWTGLERCLRKR